MQSISRKNEINGFLLIDSRRIERNSPELEGYLAKCHQSKARPLCLCHEPGIEMYIAKVGEDYIVKRMPNTGSLHAPSCDSYDVPPELSGLGQVMGSAIRENPEDGVTELKFGFSLSKSQGRSAPVPGGGEPDSVKTDGNKLTLRALLHYLWEEAGFNKWAPAMAGKRSWYVVRKYLLRAAEEKIAKGSPVADKLFIPEMFSPDNKEVIKQHRLALMSKITTPSKGARRLMILIAEVKEFAASRYGHKIIVKHLPDFHFMMNDDLHKRLLKRFGCELELWDAMERTRLVVIGTFSVGSTGVATLEEAALMTVTENWIPFENTYEKLLIDALHDRSFLKGLRYKLPLSKPMASLVLSDTHPHPTAMYVILPDATEEFAAAADSLMEESQLPSWVWSTGEGEMPVIP